MTDAEPDADVLTDEEVRVLGCLVEKAMATPDLYPLTLNALLAACNQTSNRSPVVRYGAAQVEAVLARLRERKLTRVVYSPSNRGAKYRHVLDEAWGLEPADLAVLCELAVRGPQTAAELRGRSERLRLPLSAAEVEAALDRLAARERPLVLRLPRQAGQREARVAHLLAGPPDPALLAAPAPATGERTGSGVAARVDALEAEVAELREAVADLQRRLDAVGG